MKLNALPNMSSLKKGQALISLQPIISITAQLLSHGPGCKHGQHAHPQHAHPQ